MREYKYLIVGGGMTADAAVQGVREVDGAGSIGLISAEADEPYNRPPLTKGLWKGEPLDSVWRHTREHRAELHLGRMAKTIDVAAKIITDDHRAAKKSSSRPRANAKSSLTRSWPALGLN